MKLKTNDLIIVVFIALGAVSEINWLDVPFWAYLLSGVVYLLFRTTKQGEKGITLWGGHVGNHPPKPPGGSGGD